MQRLLPAACLVVFVLALTVFAAKPPEKLDAIECTIFDALPLLKEAQPFLRDVEVPDNVDFKTRLAYAENWEIRRKDVARRFDELIRECEEHVEELKGK